MSQKVSFKSLYRKFHLQVIKHFSISFLRTVLYNAVLAMIQEIFRAKKLPNDYSLWLPFSFLGIFFPNGVSQLWFLTIGILIISLNSLFYYYDSLWEENLIIRGWNRIRNLLLDKFRKLTFEEKSLQKDIVNKLI